MKDSELLEGVEEGMGCGRGVGRGRSGLGIQLEECGGATRCGSDAGTWMGVRRVGDAEGGNVDESERSRRCGTRWR